MEGLTTDQVALVDLGRPFPDVAKFLDQKPTYSLSDLIHREDALDKNFLKKIMQPYTPKIEILHGAVDLHDQNMLGIELVENILAELRLMYKFIVVDLSNWIDDLFVKVTQEADLVILLTGLTIIDLNNMQQLWSLLTDWVKPMNKIKVVVNRINKGNKIQLESLKEITNTAVFETLPSGYLSLLDALNEGKASGNGGATFEPVGKDQKFGGAGAKAGGEGKTGTRSTWRLPSVGSGYFRVTQWGITKLFVP